MTMLQIIVFYLIGMFCLSIALMLIVVVIKIIKTPNWLWEAFQRSCQSKESLDWEEFRKAHHSEKLLDKILTEDY